MSKNTFKLTAEEVEHVAKLASLKLKRGEVKRLQEQLSDTISYIEKLKKLDVQNVSPTSQVTGLVNVFREDRVKPSMSQEEALANAKETYKGFFKVKAIF